MPYFFKSPFDINLVSGHRFDNPRHLYAGRKLRCNFLDSLSGRLTKLILHATDKKLATLKQFVSRMTFCSLRPRKRSTKVPNGVFLLRAQMPGIARNLDGQLIIKLSKGLFLEIRVFFYSNFRVMRIMQQSVRKSTRSALNQNLYIRQYLI